MTKTKAIIILLILGLGYAAQPAQAALDCAKADFGNLESPLNSSMEKNICKFINGAGGKPLIYYMSIVINFVTGAIVAIGLVTIVASGYVYMTAGGSDRIQLAKEMLAGALLGIALALAAYLILNTISPQFASEVKEPTLQLHCKAGEANACPGGQACPANGICP